MSLQVIWSEFADSQLDIIFDYYRKEAGVKVANNIILEILKKFEKLKIHPKLGQIELFRKTGKMILDIFYINILK